MKYDHSMSMKKCAIKAEVHARCCFAPANRRRDSPAAVAPRSGLGGWEVTRPTTWCASLLLPPHPLLGIAVTDVVVLCTWHATGRVCAGERGWRCAGVVVIPISPCHAPGARDARLQAVPGICRPQGLEFVHEMARRGGTRRIPGEMQKTRWVRAPRCRTIFTIHNEIY